MIMKKLTIFIWFLFLSIIGFSQTQDYNIVAWDSLESKGLLHIHAKAVFLDSIRTEGKAVFKDSVRANGKLTLKDNLQVYGNTLVKLIQAEDKIIGGDSLRVEGGTYLKNTLQVDGEVLMKNKIIGEDSARIEGNVRLKQELQVDNDVKAKERVIITKNARSPEYYSGFLGSGWYLGGDSAMAVLDYLTVRKTMKVYELLISKIRAINGGLVISAANSKIDSVYQSGSSYQIFPEDTTISFFQYDIARCDVFTGYGKKYYSALVDSLSTVSQSFWVKVIDGTDEPSAGDEIVQFGNTTNTDRQGLLYLTATDDNSPYIDVLDGVSSTDYSGCTKVRLGDLSGVSTSTWGTLSGYGLTSQNAYLENANISGTITVTGGNAATTTDISDAIDDLEIGGKNLLEQTAFSSITGWNFTSCVGSLDETETNRGYGSLKVVFSSAGDFFTNRFYKYLNSEYYTSDVLTVSFYAKADAANTFNIRTVSGNTNHEFSLTTDWQYFSFTEIPISEAHYFLGYLTSAGTIYINQIKFENGDKATGWTAAAEDVENYTDDAIGNINISSDGTLNNAGGGQVTIGGLGYTGDLNATVGATWGTNLNSIPSYLQSTAPDNSISITNNFLGFHATGSNWPVRIANDAGTGKFYAGNGSTQYVDWNGSTLSIAGNINITGGNAATQTYADGVASTAQTNAINTAASDATTKANTAQTNAANYTDTEIGDINISANGTLNNAGGGQVTIGGLGYTGDLNATNGATWGTNLYSIPATLGTPSGSGLFLSSSALGYYTGGTWTTYIDNAGNMILGDYAGDDTGLSWNQGTGILGIKGTIRAESGFFGNNTTGWIIGSSYLFNDTYTTGLAPADYPFYAGSTYANRASAPFKVTSGGAMTATNATITGTINANTGSISGLTFNDSVMYTGSSARAYSSLTLGENISNNYGFIDLRGPSGGTTYPILYVQGGRIQHQLGEFYTADVRMRGTMTVTGDVVYDGGTTDFDGTDVSNVGTLNMKTGANSLGSASNYQINVTTPVRVLTSITSGAAIYNIIVNGTTPSNGDIVWFVNASSTDINFRTASEVAGSNIKAQDNGGHTELLDHSMLCLIYYGGYWYPSVDFGQ